MDDLSGLSWNSSGAQKKPPMNSGSTFGQLRQTPPISGRSSPLPPKPSAPTSKPSTPANDSFANLVSFNSSNSGKNVSLAERQRQLIEQKSREEHERKKRLDDQYGGNNGQFWDNLEKAGQPNSNPFGSSTTQNVSEANTSRQDDDEDDLLAAFNASAPVDTSTNFPIPSATPSLPDRSNDRSTAPVSLAEDDDDPFGLAEFNARRAQKPERSPQLEDDDILGPLAKPVSDFPQPEQREPTPVAEEVPSPPTCHTPEDRAVAELVEMGFPIDKARVALSTTESGTNIQQAVGWLLNQAHHESREKARSRDTGSQEGRSGASSRNRNAERRTEFSDDFVSSASSRREHGQLPFRERSSNRNDSTDEKDPAQLASEFGNNLFKSANSLWKTGTKKVQRAVQDLNSVPDPSQPRWMREAAGADRPSSQERRVNPQQQQQRYRENRSSGSENVTNEAMMLETARASPQPEARPRRETEENFRQTPRNQRPQPARGQQHGIRPDRSQANVRAEPRLRPSRFDADEQASQAYVSPARRRKAGASVPTRTSEPDLLEASSLPSRPARPSTTSPARPSPMQKSSPPPRRPAALPPRNIPRIPPASLASIHKHRQDGSNSYKRGDYAAAHASYSSALSSTPDAHPLIITLLTNRALTALKIGEPKTAISDSDRAIFVIGTTRGESESIEFGNGEPSKDMREFFGKALMRKAEALEQLERWAEAAKIWREAVESGHGGSTSIQGRNRCEKADNHRREGPSSGSSSGSSTAPRKPNRAPKPANRPPPPISTKPSEAVNRLRAANQEADRADNEKFALSDSVDARLAAWKGGKQDNLRALLASLDTVLWPEAGWKKISMAELILPNKVKIQYMKGIGKVHPDKIPTNATTEQKMISGAVFSTLNEAWDKFKRENNL